MLDATFRQRCWIEKPVKFFIAQVGHLPRDFLDRTPFRVGLLGDGSTFLVTEDGIECRDQDWIAIQRQIKLCLVNGKSCNRAVSEAGGCIGKDFYAPMVDLLKHMAKQGTIDKADVNLFLITDSIDEAMEHIRKYAVKKFGLIKKAKK